MKIMLIAAALLGIAAVPAGAADLNLAQNRAARQQQRVANGVGQGQITPRESAVLNHGQARVARAEARAGRDGVISHNEARHVNHMQNVQSRHIFRARHNGRRT